MYTQGLVSRLLDNYLDFKHFQYGQAQQLPDAHIVETPSSVDSERELPLGQTHKDTRPWPFMEPRHAREPRDGKRRANQILELHVSILDLEQGLSKLSDDDLELLFKYHVFQTDTLESLASERKVAVSTMSRRIKRSVGRLTDFMNERELYHE